MEKINVLSEVCYDDYTQIYRYESDYNYFSPAGKYLPENIEKGKYYFASPYLSFGDYDSSCHIERSNVRVFLDMFTGHKDILHKTGVYGHESIYVDILCQDKEIISVLQSLENYPAINDEDCSLIKHEIHEESWESWIKSDLRDAILKHYDLLDITDCDNILWDFYRELCESTNVYFEVESGGIGYVDIDRLISGLPEICPSILKPEKYS